MHGTDKYREDVNVPEKIEMAAQDVATMAILLLMSKRMSEVWERASPCVHLPE